MGKAGSDRPEADALRVATRQNGVISRSQAVQAGMSGRVVKRRVRSEIWRPLQPGVYVVGGVQVGFEQRLMAAVLAGGRGTVASHRSAGLLMELDGVRGRVFELTVPPGRRRRPEGSIVHTSELAPADLSVVRGIPTTAPARTLVDLAGILPPRVLGLAVDDALRQRIVTLHELRGRAEALAARGRGGTVAIRDALDKRTDQPEIPDSGGERLLLDAFEDHRLPQPVLHHVFREGDFVAEIDLAWPRYRVGLELDGRRYHTGYGKWVSGLARRNELTLRGWMVLYVTDADVRQPRDLMARVRQALRNSGYVDDQSRSMSRWASVTG